jgi:aryl-alcohol dehydrogenase-like predicted oxidoreductase
LFCSLQRTDH